MIRSVSFLFIFCCTLFFPFTVSSGVVDRNVAIVNEDTITLSEVNELGKAFFQEVAKQTPPAQLQETMQQARYRVIGRLIDQKLMFQEARKYKIEVREDEIDDAVQRILAKNQSTMDELRKELASMGMNERQYREELREQLLGSKLVNAVVRSRVVIPEETVRAYYDAHYTEQLGEKGKYHILQLGCIWGEPDRSGNVLSRAAAKVKIEKIRQMVLDGKDFHELARLHSDMPSADDGGDLGVFKKDEMAPYMQEIILTLNPGEVSQVVEMDRGFQFFKLLSGQKGEFTSKTPYETVREKIHDQLYNQEMEKRFQTWIKEIREKAYIKIL